MKTSAIECSKRILGRARARSPLSVAVVAAALAVALFSPAARGQTTLLFEGFEGSFPGDNGWSIGDANSTGTTAYWRDVNSNFGSEATHTGAWKGYCAGSLWSLGTTILNPTYVDYMTAFMQRSIDFSGYTGAELRFWYKVPSIEACCDRGRVLVDGTELWTTPSPVTTWTEQVINLNAYVGGIHTIRFEFVSDSSSVGEGWYLDDILVTGAAPPANDSFVNATIISGASGSISGSTILATKEIGEPDHNGNSGGSSIWYRWTAPVSGPFTFFTQGSSFDTLLAVYTGSSVSALTRIGSDDDVPTGTWSGVSILATGGTTYQIAIDGYGGATGNTVLTWLQPSVSETILSATVVNYTGYVIDSDAGNFNPGYDRDYIRVNASIRSDNVSSITQPSTYRVVYRLLDPANNPQPLYDDSGAVVSGYQQTNDVVVNGSGSFTANLSADLHPAASLARWQQYHVETQVFRFSSGGTPLSDVPQFYTHFTNRVSGDLSFNVIGAMVSAPFSRPYAIKTVPGKTAFVVKPFVGLYRYDNFEGANNSDTVPVAFDCVLSNVTVGGVVPLKQNRIVVGVNMASYESGSPLTPKFVQPVITLELEPQNGVQLDSVNHLFKAYLQLSITNTPNQPAVAANSAVSADQRLLHFNGRILFGDIETQFTDLNNDPPVNLVTTPTRVATELGVSGNSGTLIGKPGPTYGNGTKLPVDLFVNGDARYTGGPNVTLTLAGSDVDELGRIRFERLSAYLNSTGAFGDLRVWLPTGFGYRFTDINSRRLSGTIDFASVRLTQLLRPLSDLSVTPPVPGELIYACEETKPFWIESTMLIWRVGGGLIEISATGNLRYVRAVELSQLEAAPIPSSSTHKPSNEQYFRQATGVEVTPAPTITPDAQGNALLTCRVNLGPNPSGYDTHFPYHGHLQWNNAGLLVISNDLIHSAMSAMNGVQPITLTYARDCGLPKPCPGAIGGANLTLATASTVSFTPDGGLAAPGTFGSPVPLEWGWVSPVSRYAHRSFNYGVGAFHMPGVFLRGDQTAEARDQRASVLLYTGINASNFTQIERFGTEEYKDGFTDYAGFNFRVGGNGAKQAESTLAGQATGIYSLTGRSKYYVRFGGVSGIHEAVLGSFPSSLTLYGYFITFANFGLSFLDSQNKDSRTMGDIQIPYPSQFTQEFEELKFTCLGALDSAKVPASSGDKPLVYWNGKFKPLAIQFETDVCDPTRGAFTLGLATSVAHVPTTLYGRLGFRPDGQIITKADPLGAEFNISSRLRLPNQLTIKGPAEEKYTLLTTTEAYFNNAADAPSETGFVTWAGGLDVPFFENVKVHLQTSANTNVANPPIFLMGGWPNHGWGSAVNNYFTDPNGFDPGHRAYDGGSLKDYRNNSANDTYHPRAQQTWLNVINFDYPLAWSSSTRSFTSFQPAKEKFLVVEISHQVKYLSAENAELTFGLEYGGVPKLNLANMAFNAISENSGVATAIKKTITDQSHAIIDEAFKAFDKVLNAQLQKFMDPVLGAVLDPVADTLYSDLVSEFNNHAGPFPSPWYTDAKILDVLTKYTNNLSIGLTDVSGAAGKVVQEVTNTLGKIDEAMGKIQGIIATNSEGQRTISRNLIKNLVGEMAAQFIGSFTDPLLNNLLKDLDPTLNQIDGSLRDLRKVVTEARKNLEGLGSFSVELKAQFTAPAAVAELSKVADLVRSEITNKLAHLDLAHPPFAELTRDQFKTLVRQKVEDRLFATTVSANMQRVLKERLYDLDASIREAVDSVFQQFNGIIREIIAKSLAEVDKSINKFVGSFGDAMGHGEINGYAHIKGDSLNLLRLDGHFQWKLPDTMEFKAFLQIKELASDGSASCSVPGGKATEVTVGARDVSVNWISPDLRANISGKFSFITPDVRPLGMGGAFELTGPLTFAAFQITELGATMAFGAQENYIGCKARVKFNQYEFAGGIFFGRTCTLEPLQLVDPDVADVLPAPVLTGAYVFAEGWFPINEALGIPSSCFFNVRVGIGAGAFFFLAGDKQVPTFGGKMKLGLSGELLCIISVRGEVLLVGLKSGDDLVFKGKGTLAASLGFCPFCLSFSKSVGMRYQKGWSVDF